MSTPPKQVDEQTKPTQVPMTSRLIRKPRDRSQNLNRTHPPAPVQISDQDIDDTYSDSEAGELTINREDEGAGHEWGYGYPDEEDDEYGGEDEEEYTSQLKRKLNELLASSQDPTKKRRVQG